MHTYTLLYVHVVFATWNRRPFIRADVRAQAHAWMVGMARENGLNEVRIGGVADHLHLLGRFDPTLSVAAVIGQLKRSSGDWLREHVPDFYWQKGYGAFAVSPDRVAQVARYIERQEEHHRRRTFRDEMEAICREAGIEFGTLGMH